MFSTSRNISKKSQTCTNITAKILNIWGYVEKENESFNLFTLLRLLSDWKYQVLSTSKAEIKVKEWERSPSWIRQWSVGNWRESGREGDERGEESLPRDRSPAGSWHRRRSDRLCAMSTTAGWRGPNRIYNLTRNQPAKVAHRMKFLLESSFLVDRPWISRNFKRCNTTRAISVVCYCIWQDASESRFLSLTAATRVTRRYLGSLTRTYTLNVTLRSVTCRRCRCLWRHEDHSVLTHTGLDPQVGAEAPWRLRKVQISTEGTQHRERRISRSGARRHARRSSAYAALCDRRNTSRGSAFAAGRVGMNAIILAHPLGGLDTITGRALQR